MTSSTGARPWWMPSCAHRFADAPPIVSTRSGSNEAPHARAVGKVAAFHASEPGQALLVDDRGDAQPGLLLQPPLLGPEPARTLDRVDRSGAVDAREVSDAVSGRVLVLRRVGHLARHRGDDLVALVDPVADELRQLLLEGHRSRTGPARGPRPAEVRGCHAQPLTAPVSPPTMRRSNRLKNDQGGDHRQRREREHLGGVDGVLRRERLHAERQRVVRLVVQDEQGKEVAVPAADEGEDRRR